MEVSDVILRWAGCRLSLQESHVLPVDGLGALRVVDGYWAVDDVVLLKGLEETVESWPPYHVEKLSGLVR